METTPEKNSEKSGLDTAIKVLTILKLLVQLAFYGIMLGSMIWLLLNNPIPGMLADIQSQLGGALPF